MRCYAPRRWKRGSAAAPALRLACLAASIALLWPGGAQADGATARPIDAPRVDSARVPPLPPEYLVQQHGGVLFGFHPSARERVRALPSVVERTRAELSGYLGRRVLEAFQVRVAAAPGELSRLSPAEPPPYAAAVTFSDASLVVMSLSSPLSTGPINLEEALRHALAHLSLDQAIAPDGAAPPWFHEGFASRISANHSARRMQTLALASLGGRILPLADVAAGFSGDATASPLIQSEAADFAGFLLEDERVRSLPALVQELSRGASLADALPRTYGPGIESTWRRDVARRHSLFPVLAALAVLWAIVTTVVVARRLRLRRAAATIPGPRRARPARRDGLTARALVASRERSRETTEVPKVEHAGRWHTLH